jgi:hypothetical protein
VGTDCEHWLGQRVSEMVHESGSWRGAAHSARHARASVLAGFRCRPLPVALPLCTGLPFRPAGKVAPRSGVGV